ncbi:MAG: hypothetical protein IPJ77_23120 [Planctomycetes bacterium]|nr:hypothetical protein [Planctomycetota bacterium]
MQRAARPLPCLAAWLVLATAASAAQGAYDLTVKEVEGDVFATLRAKNARVEEILADVAARTHKKLVGLERMGKSEPLSAELSERPLNQLLYTVAGCAGARLRVNPTTIEVLSDLGGGASIEELEEQATIAYLRALQANPTHPQGARAELVLGDIQEKHGNLRAAVGHFELVSRNYPESDLVPESLWRAGSILVRLADWTSGTTLFTRLANLEQDHAYSSRARLQLARCLVHSGDARQSLLLLDALDNLFPTEDRNELQSRLFVRALALRGMGRHGDALRTLTRADEMGTDPAWEAPAMELRAQAFEHFDRPAEAARAWLRLSQLTDGARRDEALVNAARLAQAAGDPLSVLMIERTAVAAGSHAGSRLEAYVLAARRELGLAAPTAETRLETALERARGYLSAHLARQAVLALQPVWNERDALDETSIARLARLYATAVEEDNGVDAAIDILRRAAREVRMDEPRKLLLVTAGELYEKHDRYEDAARVYGGDL